MAVGSLARLLSVLSAECDELAVRVDGMHHVLSGDPGKPHGKAATGEFVIAAQDIDFVQQHLASLAEFLMLVAEGTPPGIMIDLEGPLHSVRLSDLRNRLSGEEFGDDAPVLRAGELELL